MMDGIYQSWQNGVMWACLGMLGVMAVGIILYGFGLAWGKVREWWSLPLLERERDLTVRCHEAVCRLAGIDPAENIYPPVYENSRRVDYY